MRGVRFSAVLACLACGTAASAQPADASFSAHDVRPDSRYLRAFWLDTKTLATQPLHWNRSQWLAAGAVGGLLAVAFWQDDNIRDIFQRNAGDGLDFYAVHLFNPFGNMYSFSVVASLYADGVLAGNARSKRTALDAARALVLTAVATRAVKWVSNRERPLQEGIDRDEGEFNPFDTGDKRFDSFYSGHTATAFCLAAVLAGEYGEARAVPVIAYTLASAVGLTRIYLDKHWSSDVIAGAAVGWYIGHTVQRSGNWRIAVTPVSTGQGTGLRFGYTF